MTQRAVSPIVAAALLLCAAPAALAAEGRTPIWQPTVITVPGKYFVSRNLPPPAAGGVTIQILVPDVEIDLNGMQLDVTGAAYGILAIGTNRVSVRNGHLVGNGVAAALHVEDAVQVTVEELTIDVAGGATRGIELDNVSDFDVRRNLIAGAGNEAIRITGPGPFAPYHGAVADNILRSSNVGIFLSLGSSVIVRNNAIESNMLYGIRIEDSGGILIAENTAQGMAEGISLFQSSGCKIYNNVADETADAGIHLGLGSDDNLVLNNVVRQSGAQGLLVESERNHVEGNLLNRNGLFGLHFMSTSRDNVYRRNTARGNAGAGCAGISTPDLCDEAPSGFANTSFGDNFMPNQR
jgi:parallel beta-helix repeat protein